ncbi:sulfite exporter TauE/SafE family protein [Salisaeta longa]|uniref:sulfite exporter TauE/SafE family protein n=1 Tax=Salisaeta longa TaxID=503170 RepID=UPI0003B328FB|nr:sulfite exporter TauE/SafE family protein [Salisaeta longa]
MNGLFEFWYMLPVSVVFATVALGSGVEGATFFSPFFILVLGLDPMTAIGAGLITEVFGFSSGLYSYVRRRLIDYRMGGQLLAVAVPMALAGTYAAHFIADDILKTILGMGLVAVAISFVRTPDAETVSALNDDAVVDADEAERCVTPSDGEEVCYRVFNRTEGLFTGGIGGLFIGMVSTGLGEMNGYLLLQRCRIPSRVAIATSVFVVAVTALVASAGHVVEFVRAGGDQLTQLLHLLLWVVPGVVVGGQVGPAVAERIPDRVLELGMGVLFLLVSGILLAEVALT